MGKQTEFYTSGSRMGKREPEADFVFGLFFLVLSWSRFGSSGLAQVEGINGGRGGKWV